MADFSHPGLLGSLTAHFFGPRTNLIFSARCVQSSRSSSFRTIGRRCLLMRFNSDGTTIVNDSQCDFGYEAEDLKWSHMGFASSSPLQPLATTKLTALQTFLFPFTLQNTTQPAQPGQGQNVCQRRPRRFPTDRHSRRGTWRKTECDGQFGIYLIS